MAKFLRCDGCSCECPVGKVEGWREIASCVLDEDGENEGSMEDGPQICGECVAKAKKAIADALGLPAKTVGA